MQTPAPSACGVPLRIRLPVSKGPALPLADETDGAAGKFNRTRGLLRQRRAEVVRCEHDQVLDGRPVRAVVALQPVTNH